MFSMLQKLGMKGFVRVIAHDTYATKTNHYALLPRYRLAFVPDHAYHSWVDEAEDRPRFALSRTLNDNEWIRLAGASLFYMQS